MNLDPLVRNKFKVITMPIMALLVVLHGFNYRLINGMTYCSNNKKKENSRVERSTNDRNWCSCLVLHTYKCECGCTSNPCVLFWTASSSSFMDSISLSLQLPPQSTPEVAWSLQCQGVTFFMHIPITGGTTRRNTNNLLLHP